MPEKIAFLFLTRGEVNNVQVWEKYFQDADNSKYRIVIHAKNPTTLTSSIWTSRNSTILKPIPTAWGTISLVKATIYLLQTAISDPSVTKFVLLSEFCLPTNNFNNMYNTLISETNRSRIHWMLGKNMDRYSIIKSYVNMPAHNWAKQSQWMCLDRKHVSTLLSPIHTNILNQQLKDYMYCPAPDEHFFINMFLYVVRINNNEIINHPITFVDWSNNSKHPVTFNTIIKDVIELCRKNKIFFARKFVQMPLSSTDINYLLDLEQNKAEEQKPIGEKEKQIETKAPNVFSNAFTSGSEVDLSTITSEYIVDNLPVIVPDDAYTNVLDVLNSLDNPVDEPLETTSTTSTTSTTTTTTTIQKQIGIEEPISKVVAPNSRQKQAVLDFFTNIIDNLDPKRIQTIYSALFDEEPFLETANVFNLTIEPEPEPSYVNPLDLLTMAIEQVEDLEKHA